MYLFKFKSANHTPFIISITLPVECTLTQAFKQTISHTVRYAVNNADRKSHCPPFRHSFNLSINDAIT
jgi:hypothetical protein